MKRVHVLMTVSWAFLAAFSQFAIGQESKQAKPTAPAQEAKPTVTTPASTQTASDREQRIAELQKQVEELKKQLEALKPKTVPTTPPATVPAPPAAGPLNADWVKSLNWRAIGPANMGGRIVALSVFDADPNYFFVATGGGGLLKTTNNGITFEHLFDKQGVVAIGDVCIAPSNKDIIWVGTGENNPRNSVSWGDGVYKSVDGGKTWTHMGLKETFQIGKIIVHPKNPDIVYVGALGRLWGANAERGLYKTVDGGKTWTKVLFVDDKTGVIDMRMSPADPETLLVATWERKRDLYDTNEPIVKHAPGTALYKTTDGGKNFKKITKGLPTVKLGRIGLDYYRKDPSIVYAIIDTEKAGFSPNVPGQTPPAGPPVYLGVAATEDAAAAKVSELTADSPAEKAGLKAGDIILSVGDAAVPNFRTLTSIVRTKKPGDKSLLKIKRGEETISLEVTFQARPVTPVGGGAEGAFLVDPAKRFGSILDGQQENVQDRQGPEGFQGGGVFKSTDGGESWTRVNSLNPRPMYFSQVRVDPSDDKYVYVLGIAIHRSDDGGKSFRGDGGRNVHSDGHALWIDPRDGRHMIVGVDGGVYVSYDRTNQWDLLNQVAIGQFYHVAVDSKMPYRVYGGLQDNGTWGGPSYSRTGGAVNEDWQMMGWGDGFKCQVDANDPDQIYWSAQNGSMSTRNLRTGEISGIRPVPERGKTFRFNWNTPFILSHHNSRIFYAAGNYVFKSLDKGKNLKPISPSIVRTDKGTATSIAESPKNADVLYVGTDDGLFWGTKDGGKTWVDLTPNVGLAGPRYVSTIEPSRYEEGRVYVCFDGHRSDVDDPLIFVSEDFGKTWKPIRGNLPTGSTKCLREDIQSPDVLWLGTEFAAWASVDRGASWSKINGNLPTVAVMELAQHPTAGEIVAATHGRSLWILDAGPIRESTGENLKEKAHLYRPKTVVRWQNEPTRGTTNRKFVGQNPPSGASIYVNVGAKVEKIGINVYNDQGTKVRDLTVSRDPGLHRVSWDMLVAAPAPSGDAPRSSSSGGVVSGLMSGMMRGLAGGRMIAAPPGTYRVVLTVDGKEQSAPLKIERDPAYPATDRMADEVPGDEEEDEEARERRVERGDGVDR